MGKSSLTLLLAIVFLNAFAQKVKKVEGEYIYVVPSHVTLEYAMNYAIEQARKSAIANVFGTIISQTTSAKVENDGEQSNVNITFISDSELKGIWLEDIGKPIVEQDIVEGQLVVKAEVHGRARERVSAGIDFYFAILRNGTDDSKNGASEFKSGDDLYLSFLSPVNGYLTVYLIDDNNQAFCLLPYRNQTEGFYPIKANQRYIFFSIQDVLNEEQSIVDEYQMTCERSSEINQIYIIFSPNEFVKAVDQSIDNHLPRQLSFEAFLRWLAKCKNTDLLFTEKHQILTIKK